MWVHYMSCIYSLLATALFVSMGRRHFNVPSVHIHHIVTLVLVWTSVKYHPLGFALIQVLLSAPVHFLMHLYSLLHIHHKIRPFLRWKVIIPPLQLSCFLVGWLNCVYCSVNKVYREDKEIAPIGFMAVYIVYLPLLFYLFGGYYWRKRQQSFNQKNN
ncbi:very long chain fatty acid elongase 5-like [Convolutriloba macropyga]|uniref:very long chain fatty acid elongase 5-like n=1 Tax=Convolutriloba macropyga TaxID=536237 RepID=UPI003F52705F